MPNGSRREHDVFISYVRADNAPPPRGGHWVAQFRANLSRALAINLGREPDICFFDSEDRDGRTLHLSEAALDHARNSAALIVVYSPGYVANARAVKELEAFAGLVTESGRIIVLQLLPVRREDHLPQLDTIRPIRFWKDVAGLPAELTAGNDGTEYSDRIAAIARHLAGLLGKDAARQDSASLKAAAVAEPLPAPASSMAKAQPAAPQHERGTPEFWLNRASVDRRLLPGSEPLVLVSFASEDQSWVDILHDFLAPQLEQVRDPDGRFYQLWNFSDAKRGTTPGDEFPEVIAEKMWHCRAALLFLSRDYFRSRYCRVIELPFLLWRREHHGAMCLPLRLGMLPIDSIRLPKFGGSSRNVVFDEMIDDRQAAVDFASSPYRDLTLKQLKEQGIESEIEKRFKGVATRVVDYLKKQHAAIDDN